MDPPSLNHNLKVPPEFDGRSSSSMSSPPNSPPQNHAIHDTIEVARPSQSNPGKFAEGVVAAASATPGRLSTNTTATATNSKTSTTTANGNAPEKPKRQRKKKEVGLDGKPIVDDKPKEKKPRKPREPKVKTAGANDDKPAASRKKQKVETKVEPAEASTAPRQSTLTEMVGSYQQPANSSSNAAAPLQPQHRASDSMTYSSIPPSFSKAQSPRPFSSGQNYDPIRGSTRASYPPPPPNPNNVTASAQASPHANRASASPAISSLIDPPPTIKASASATMNSPHANMQPPSLTSQQIQSPQKPTASMASPPQPRPSPPFTKPSTMANFDGAMDLDRLPYCANQAAKKAPKSKSSSSPTPKAARPTPPPAQVPKGTGSGLLSSSDLFGGPSTSEPTTRKGVNIDIHIPLNPAGGNTVNIAQEIAKKYGRDAVNPRAAAHREMMLRMSAEANKFAGTADGDEMSVDLLSEAEGDSNVEMGGMEDGQSNTGLDTGADGPKPRKRRKKVEEYDKEDDFIDDTELAWQEQAAVAKDGFFVYSGPLIPEGEQPQIETSAPTRARGGRGSRGGRGARSANTSTTHASLADTKAREAAPSTRARARGTRGTSAPRKPRITKADRERLELEKAERERAAGMGGQAAGNSTTTATATATTAATNGAANTTTTTQQGFVQPTPQQQQPAFYHQQSTGTMA
ncbi:HIR complex subunit [Saxophila tyrrhenica]|uniref:HIR complex subunit n=1 Tax=Saxophila tyrrhenica TaxID=1690608 RepID=A0AAV9PKU1_9PEZI|nr:HIR complex subunit [Saxophila tyrrhenica]